MNRATLLDYRLRELHSNRVELVRPVRELARIFRMKRAAMDSRYIKLLQTGDLETTIEEIEAYAFADTFEDFLKVNRLPVYEEELR